MYDSLAFNCGWSAVPRGFNQRSGWVTYGNEYGADEDTEKERIKRKCKACGKTYYSTSKDGPSICSKDCESTFAAVCCVCGKTFLKSQKTQKQCGDLACWAGSQARIGREYRANKRAARSGKLAAGEGTSGLGDR